MANLEKLLKRIKDSEKVPNDISSQQFLNLVKHLGYQTRPGKGSHTIVYEMDQDGKIVWHMTVCTGHPEPVDPKAIKEIRDKLLNK